MLLQVLSDPEALPGGYGAALLQTILALGAVCLLAWVVLRWAAQRGFGTGGFGTGGFGTGGLGAGGLGSISKSRAPGQEPFVQVLQRIPLDARRSMFLVKVGPQALLLGLGEGGQITVLKELDAAALPEAGNVDPPSASFSEVWKRVAGRGAKVDKATEEGETPDANPDKDPVDHPSP